VDLVDDDTVALLAVQVIDRERAVAAVRALRDLHARYAGTEAAGEAGAEAATEAATEAAIEAGGEPGTEAGQ
jgi:hypothetical protein